MCVYVSVCSLLFELSNIYDEASLATDFDELYSTSSWLDVKIAGGGKVGNSYCLDKKL